jgi:hypothetical protein
VRGTPNPTRNRHFVGADMNVSTSPSKTRTRVNLVAWMTAGRTSDLPPPFISDRKEVIDDGASRFDADLGA